jgi:hypothetical protein
VSVREGVLAGLSLGYVKREGLGAAGVHNDRGISCLLRYCERSNAALDGQVDCNTSRNVLSRGQSHGVELRARRHVCMSDRDSVDAETATVA